MDSTDSSSSSSDDGDDGSAKDFEIAAVRRRNSSLTNMQKNEEQGRASVTSNKRRQVKFATTMPNQPFKNSVAPQDDKGDYGMGESTLPPIQTSKSINATDLQMVSHDLIGESGELVMDRDLSESKGAAEQQSIL